MSQTQYSLALHKAMSLLRRKFYSEREMRQKLKQHEYDDETVDSVITHLGSVDYINDYKLCQALFDKYSQDGKCGFRLAAAKMTARGLPKTMIQEFMREYDFDNEAEQALLLVKKRYGFSGGLNSRELGKIARYLTSRGFSASTVSKTIHSLKSVAIELDEEIWEEE